MRLPSIMFATLVVSAVVVLAAFSGDATATCCYEPTTEVSNPVKEATTVIPGGITVTMFQQTVSDSYGNNFDGTEVSESSPYGGTDHCWYSGAPFPSTSKVTGGEWFVGESHGFDGAVNGTNQWGYDLDGFDLTLVDDIRSHAALPCTNNTPQQMGSTITYCVQGYPYYFNVQTNTITATTVENCRGGYCKTVDD